MVNVQESTSSEVAWGDLESGASFGVLLVKEKKAGSEIKYSTEIKNTIKIAEKY